MPKIVSATDAKNRLGVSRRYPSESNNGYNYVVSQTKNAQRTHRHAHIAKPESEGPKSRQLENAGSLPVIEYLQRVNVFNRMTREEVAPHLKGVRSLECPSTCITREYTHEDIGEASS